MKMKSKLITLLFLSIFVLVSCGEDEPVGTEYSVQIMQPDNGAKQVGDVMHIHVNFDEASGGTVHHINVQIIDNATGNVIYDAPSEAHVHEQSGHYEHHDDFTLDVVPNSNLTLIAVVWGHEAGVGEVMDEVSFVVQ